MKISDLIQELKEYQEKHGDSLVGFSDDFGKYHEPELSSAFILGHGTINERRVLEIKPPYEYVVIREDCGEIDT